MIVRSARREEGRQMVPFGVFKESGSQVSVVLILFREGILVLFLFPGRLLFRMLGHKPPTT